MKSERRADRLFESLAPMAAWGFDQISSQLPTSPRGALAAAVRINPKEEPSA